MENAPHTQQPAYSLVGLVCHEVLLCAFSTPPLFSASHDTSDSALDSGAVWSVRR